MNLSDTIKIGKLELKNRIMMAAMDLGYVDQGFVTDQLIAFYRERAKGGVGLIIAGGCYTEKIGRMWKGMIGLDDDQFIPGLRKLTDVVHENGARIGAQLLHGGGCCHPFFIKDQPVSASAVRCLNKKIGNISRELSPQEIKETVSSFALAAKRAKEAGFDVIEIIGSMGYLINQFLSPLTNKRKDRYGGDIHGRMTFLLELIVAVKEEVGQDFPLIIKISGDELMLGGNKLQEHIEIAKFIEKAGVDAISVSPGRHDAPVSVMSMYIPQGAYLFLTEEIKKEIHLPVIAGNRLSSCQIIKQSVENGQTDLVSLGRPLIADPELPNKILEQRCDEIRWCLSCNQGCFDNIVNFKPVSCTVNAEAGKENIYKIKKPVKSRKVMVIGGGPAGMEAARVCAFRGHQVSLFEKSDRIGGQVHYASLPWGRSELRNIIIFLESELRRLDVKFFLNREVNPAIITREEPGAVIIATGAKMLLPSIKGINSPHVLSATEVLSGKQEVGQHVVIIGGGSVGCETAIHLAKMGSMQSANAIFLIRNRIADLVLERKKVFGRGIGVSTRWVVLDLLKELGIDLINEVEVEEIRFSAKGRPENGLLFSRNSQQKFLKADTVVIAAGFEAEQSLYRQINELPGIDVYVIGDAREPSNILNAIHEGFEVGYNI
jgi:2,4-dienoyl-CoA reductase (NADPH2)